jgi:hypothetical protein
MQLYDQYGRPVSSFGVPAQITATEFRIGTNGIPMYKNRTTNLWHEVYVENYNGIAVIKLSNVGIV